MAVGFSKIKNEMNRRREFFILWADLPEKNKKKEKEYHSYPRYRTTTIFSHLLAVDKGAQTDLPVRSAPAVGWIHFISSLETATAGVPLIIISHEVDV